MNKSDADITLAVVSSPEKINDEAPLGSGTIPLSSAPVDLKQACAAADTSCPALSKSMNQSVSKADAEEVKIYVEKSQRIQHETGLPDMSPEADPALPHVTKLENNDESNSLIQVVEDEQPENGKEMEKDHSIHGGDAHDEADFATDQSPETEEMQGYEDDEAKDLDQPQEKEEEHDKTAKDTDAELKLVQQRTEDLDISETGESLNSSSHLEKEMTEGVIHKSVPKSPVKEKKEKPKKNKLKPRSSGPLRRHSNSPQKLTKPMNLRHILQKHEKKVQKPEIDAYETVGFYGSMSAIPFLKHKSEDNDHEEKPKDKVHKKKKFATSSKQPDTEEAIPGEEEKEMIHSPSQPRQTFVSRDATEGVDDEAEKSIGAPEITVIKDYDEEDVKLWKSMSIQDGSFMDEVSHRPTDMLPLVPTPSPKKTATVKISPYKEHGFLRPDDWLEFDSPVKRSPQKTYKTKNVTTSTSVGALPVFGVSKEGDEKGFGTTSEHQKTDDLSGEKISSSSDTAEYEMDMRHEEDAQDKSQRGDEPGPLPDEPHENGSSTSKSPSSEKPRLHDLTKLTIRFHDGCTVKGQFGPNETVTMVMSDLKRDLLRNDINLPDFELYAILPNGKHNILDPTMTLYDYGLVPAALVFFKWNQPMAVTAAPGWYLAEKE